MVTGRDCEVAVCEIPNCDVGASKAQLAGPQTRYDKTNTQSETKKHVQLALLQQQSLTMATASLLLDIASLLVHETSFWVACRAYKHG